MNQATTRWINSRTIVAAVAAAALMMSACGESDPESRTSDGDDVGGGHGDNSAVSNGGGDAASSGESSGESEGDGSIDGGEQPTPNSDAPGYCFTLAELAQLDESESERAFELYTDFLEGLAQDGPEEYRAELAEHAAAFAAAEDEIGADVLSLDLNLLTPASLDLVIDMGIAAEQFGFLVPKIDADVRAACGSDFLDSVADAQVL